MKIENGNQKFHPVTITIETQGEADLLAAALGAVATGNQEYDMVYNIYCALDREGGKYKAEGVLKIREA